MKKFFCVAGLLSFLCVWLFPSSEAQAVSQWARKYKMNCQSCHTAFPRLNYFGEKFQRNGFQLPETEDGDENKEKLSDTAFIDNLINMFGVRIAVSPASITTNGLTRPDGTVTTRTSFGNTDWVQFFSAGSIFKNASIFIETEITNTAIKNNWFTLGYHNLFGHSLLNLRVGKLGVMNWVGQSGRLRMIPNIQVEGWKNFLTAEGTTSASTTLQDQVAMGEPQPGIELYGYKGPFLYSVGVVNGNALTDNNEFKNVFGTLRLEATDGPIQGSSISGWGYWGTDTFSTVRRKDRFYRVSGAANLRWKNWDVIGAFLHGRDSDWILSTAAPNRNTTHAASGQVGYLINPKWYAAAQYDYVTDTFKNTATTSNFYHKASPSIWFMPRENMRIGLVQRFEFKGRAGGRQHEFLVHARAMF
ncbi:MAG: hypothetical protein A2W61_06875 [Deltaproteobacteria bacterium RIFCSPLOWO2_01_44_7]|nr:MAG: hypothetical protein A2712_01135 [Deltaproteobacteria bacterium RIFCSPHIGHO2_01_FULL_43_49]OGQ15259.1 MAG: hypothetical protein A3D22_04340 [Deltaproteobacteria bacterium RIFCSPHIGHO2_02_FULL_44_53]OGQ27117.1 MAG: hypothetical protein A3D98_01725 [Deltaproteobacteria bacterium RIFCSPHIGHO2_12_FULL_44_21]OGQ31775.1 MAG: hypothetical protein A2979_05500 [Deltaproteobacteria bacterium RIFCSPLOWO2_01_FULL_45_74]OGQ42977.1 MAG: hypothetical protein A3I70_07805 [Deltaproteobacteria bacterium 